MAVTDAQLAALRAQLAGNLEEHKRLFAQLDPIPARTGYRALVTAAFCKAVEQRFAPDSSADDVIEFVGDVRYRTDGTADEIDPRTAERLILAVYTDEPIGDLDPKTSFGTQILLLAALTADAQLDDAGLDEFLADARKLADQWTS
jgi:hypothetical protein